MSKYKNTLKFRHVDVCRHLIFYRYTKNQNYFTVLIFFFSNWLPFIHAVRIEHYLYDPLRLKQI